MADKKGKKFNRNNNNDDDSMPRQRKIKKKVCMYCADKNLNIDYKDVELDYKNADQLKKFVNERGKILPRRATGACAKHQRVITLAVKRARHIAILPYTQD